jgi:hypothetical protein
LTILLFKLETLSLGTALAESQFMAPKISLMKTSLEDMHMQDSFLWQTPEEIQILHNSL